MSIQILDADIITKGEEREKETNLNFVVQLSTQTHTPFISTRSKRKHTSTCWQTVP